MNVENLKITLVGGPTALLEIAGLRLLTDPTFDPAGGAYTTGPVTLRKLSGPALGLGGIGHIDGVLLSHDQHFDNLDHAGRTMLGEAGRVFTTSSGGGRLGGQTVGLKPWHSATISAPDGRTLRITATPGRHGPPGIEPVSGEVTGFVLAFDDQQNKAIYFSGDTVWFEGVGEVARKYNITVIVLTMGAATPIGPEPVTMTTADAIQTAHAFPNATIVPIHFEGWAHFSEGSGDIQKAFAEAGLCNRLRLLEPGQSTSVPLFAPTAS